jgi:murein L,D-transpeptidase YcbB/YkuD
VVRRLPAKLVDGRRMMHLSLLALAASLAALALAQPAIAAPAPAASPAAAEAAAPEAMRGALQQLLGGDDALLIGGKNLDGAALRRLYQARSFQPIWQGRPDRIAALTAAALAAADDGIDLAVGVGEARKGAAPNSVALRDAEEDLVLSDDALRLAAALATGRSRPDQWEEDWAVALPAFDAVAGLDKALSAERLAIWYAGLAPNDFRYLRLKGAFVRYRELARAGWPQVPGGPTIKPGMSDARVAKIRQRLLIEGDLPLDTVGDDSFDETLETGIRTFQQRHGIVGDSAIGAKTIAAMNVPARARLEQIAMNLERWRSLPRDFGRNYIFVNVPGEALEIYENDQLVMTMRVVVGDPGHPTPVVQTRLQAVTFNPAWRIPTSIYKKEIYPKTKVDPKYLEKNQMVFKPGSGLEQLPGPKNPLGQIKFETPNKFDVYLHDTPTKTSFERVARALSHGCVRVEDARLLANYLFAGSKWDSAAIEAAIATGETQKVEPARHPRISILYFTSFVDPDGTVEFRDDLYGRDKRLKTALQGGAPTAITVSAKPKPGVSG